MGQETNARQGERFGQAGEGGRGGRQEGRREGRVAGVVVGGGGGAENEQDIGEGTWGYGRQGGRSPGR